jgi:hypothetical protein
MLPHAQMLLALPHHPGGVWRYHASLRTEPRLASKESANLGPPVGPWVTVLLSGLGL